MRFNPLDDLASHGLFRRLRRNGKADLRTNVTFQPERDSPGAAIGFINETDAKQAIRKAVLFILQLPYRVLRDLCHLLRRHSFVKLRRRLSIPLSVFLRGVGVFRFVGIEQVKEPEDSEQDK